MSFTGLDEIVNIFGLKDEVISEEYLNVIIDELESINDLNTNIELAKRSIELGKDQILKYILDNNNFDKKQIDILKQHIKQLESDKKYKDIYTNNYELIVNYNKKKKWE
jgi:hypothetical protein